MSNIEKQSYEVYFDGDLSRYYECAFLNIVDNGWKVEISYCTPEKSGKDELVLEHTFHSLEELDIYIKKLEEIFRRYCGKSICNFIDEIFSDICALDTLL